MVGSGQERRSRAQERYRNRATAHPSPADLRRGSAAHGRDVPEHLHKRRYSCTNTGVKAPARDDQFLTYFFTSVCSVNPPNTLPSLSAATPSGIATLGSGAEMKAVTLPSVTLPMRMPRRNGGFTFSFDCESAT